MRRKLKCGMCGTTKNAATNQTLYALGETVPMATLNTVGECWDCGEKRREEEEAKKQKQLSRLFGEDEVN